MTKILDLLEIIMGIYLKYRPVSKNNPFQQFLRAKAYMRTRGATPFKISNAQNF